MSTTRAALTLGLLVTLTTGCSLVNPHVRWQRPPDTTLKDGIDYANRAKDRYKEAIGDQAALTTMTGLALIPLGAAALGLGITEGPGTAITALGLTGATGFAASSWLSSRPRQLVYVAGIKAMSCLVDAVSPLAFSDQQAMAFDQDLKSLGASMTAVREQIAAVAELRARVARENREDPAAKPEILTETDRDLTLAQSALDSARAVRDAGNRLSGERARAGLVLMSAVDAVGAEVDRALATTLPDLQSLPGIVGGLSQMTTQFTPTPAPKSTAAALADTKTDAQLHTQGTPSLVTRALDDARATLKRLVADMERTAQSVAAVVNAVAEAKPLATLKQCNVETVATGIVVEPSGPLELTAGQAASRRLLVSGGKPPYGADFDEGSLPGLTVTQPVAGRVVVEATNPPARELTLRIADTAGATRAVRVLVKPAASAAVVPPPVAVAPVPPTPPPPTPAVTLSGEDERKVTSALCMPAGATLTGTAAAAAIRQYRATVASTATGPLTAEEIGELTTAAACRPGRRNYYENGLDPTRIRAIQKKLGVQETGTLDPATRAAASAFAAAKTLTPKDGTLTAGIVKALGA
jgi:hypothetical protein